MEFKRYTQPDAYSLYRRHHIYIVIFSRTICTEFQVTCIDHRPVLVIKLGTLKNRLPMSRSGSVTNSDKILLGTFRGVVKVSALRKALQKGKDKKEYNRIFFQTGKGFILC